MSQHRRPIVIRRKKAAAHHGSHGSWKIAYADFMTAMMAFFLVMWLLAGTSKAEFEQISEYFRTPLKVALAGGDRNSASNSAIPGGGDDVMHSEGERSRITIEQNSSMATDMSALSRLKARLEALMQEDPALRDLRSQMRLDLTPEGLRIQIVDSQRRPMFEVGSARVATYMHRILTAIAPLLNELPNKLTLSGHTDDLPFAAGLKGYSNWELSTDRANASRRELVAGGLEPEKLLRVIGMADTMNMPDEEDSALNRRISILVLNSRAQKMMEQENMAPTTPAIIDGDKVPLSIEGFAQSGSALDTPEASEQMTQP
ncbi:flagellar motor protein MotB [Kushneria phyllosphaerae]|uniref:Motility protein B n=1 Tax=Kushneria phyllosphaerae TaxID=2100822 RepID=A0A2R8CPS5_9GAMM|nr:flagellar motor protein MotB [Kushneria phyllosphaerae]SPJ34896.1 Motility protein B [Kushneria phyllosphaerae]